MPARSAKSLVRLDHRGKNLLLLALSGLLGASTGTHAAEAITPRRLVEVVDLSAPTVSPDGRRVAFRIEQAAIERGTINTFWYVQDVDGPSAPRRVADGGFALHSTQGVSAPEVAVWSSDGRWIYYRAMIDGRIDVWRAAADGSGAEPITQDAADVRAFILSGDDRAVTYSVGATREQVSVAERAEYDRGVRIDRSVPIGQSLFGSGHIEGRPATQRFGADEIERVFLLADVADRWKVVDLSTRTTQELAPAEIQQLPSPAVIGTNGLPEPWIVARDDNRKRVALLTHVGDGTGLRDKPGMKLSVESGTRTRIDCMNTRCMDKEITGIQWRPGGDELLFTVTDRDEGGAQAIFRWNTQADTVQPVASSRGLLNGGRDLHSACGVSVAALVCVAAEADRPPRLERIDVESGQRQVLFDPNAALAADMAAMVPARLLRWTDANGQQFTGQFFAAHRTGDHAPPLFINYYSCSGFVRGGTGDEWPFVSLVGYGIAALCINFAPLRLDAVERYDQGLSAVRSAVELLASAGEIDPMRVGMGGLSLGTEVTFWTLINSDLLAAASVSSPRTSPLAYSLLSLYGESFFPRLRQLWQLGSPDETPERWRRLSPVFNLDKIRAPILMQLPEQEYIYSLDYAIPLIRDDRAELYVFPDEAHFKFQPRHKLAVYERNLDWFRFWLLDQEDPDPIKQEQYMHWRHMKDRIAR